MSGTPRLRWLRKLTKDTSTLSFTRSVRLKLLDMAKSQLMVPGPSIMPTPEVPNRPIGGAAFTPAPTEQLTRSGFGPGQTKPDDRIHWAAFRRAGAQGPTRTGC